MKLTITNKGAHAVPVASEDEGGWLQMIEPGATEAIDRARSDVWVIGDKPGHLETIAHGVRTIAEALVRFFQRRTTGEDSGSIAVSIRNDGDESVRVIPGTVEAEGTLSPGATSEFSAQGYVELRELGNAPQMAGDEAP